MIRELNRTFNITWSVTLRLKHFELDIHIKLKTATVFRFLASSYRNVKLTTNRVMYVVYTSSYNSANINRKHLAL